MTEDPFVAHRGLLFRVAYQVLGSSADAEDVVQETWLRWGRVDQNGVEDPRSYLIQAVTRQALNRLRTLRRQREDYVGEWLPEPLLTSPDLADDVDLAESLSMALLTVLETLTPAERAVFVLKEAFDLPYAEIAAAVDKSPAAVRQLAHRARAHVAARRPRVAVNRDEQHRVVDRFLHAVDTGDLQALLDVLAPDVVLVADGGGIARAVRKPVEGGQRVAKLLARFRAVMPEAQIVRTWLNGAPGALIELEPGATDTAVSVVVANARVTHVYVMRNPTKLTRLHEASMIAR